MSIPKCLSAAVLVLGVLATTPSFAVSPVPVQPPSPPTHVVLCTMTKLNPPQVGKANVTVTVTSDFLSGDNYTVVMGSDHDGTVMGSGCGLFKDSPRKFVYTAKPVAAIPTWTCHVEYTPNVTQCIH